MDWNSPLGILRRAMGIERDGYIFYTEAAERAAGPRGQNMFLSLAADEEMHLRLLLVEYRSLEQGKGWIDPTRAMYEDFPLDPANPDLPGEDYPEAFPIFTPARDVAIENDIAALEFGMETEELSVELYREAAEKTTDPLARQAYEFLTGEEMKHFELLKNSRDYLADNQTWWDDEQYPFFTG
jgi:rubrerythrin